MPKAERNDPFASFNFIVEIEGIARAGFTEVSGLSSDTDVIEYREGADAGATPRKLPGLRRSANLVLKRGLSQDRGLWEWRKKTLDGQVERRSGAVVLLDEARKPALRWEFSEGWPVRWEGPMLNARGGEVAIESLEIAHEGLRLV
ncbi:MAG: phage tail protein [Planctomycetes bacterium]|nr:phage tail protein [Planctomycetota bacterium]